MLQRCPKCKQSLSEDAFVPSARGVKGRYCRSCMAEYCKPRTQARWAEYKESDAYKGPGAGRPVDLDARARKAAVLQEKLLKKAIQRAWALERDTLKKEYKSVTRPLKKALTKQRNAIRSAARCWGLDPDDIWARYQSHDRKCDLCRRPEQDLPQRLSIDHCHQTGRFRGFLCAPCNGALGVLGDTAESLRRAVDYLDL